MKLHYLQHVPFEGLGHIQTWAEAQNAEISCTRLYAGDPLPAPEAFDLLVIMGGPMGIYDETDYPWLQKEKAFIRSVIEAGRKILGVCLGAQLIADVLGAKVYPGPQKEIGWFPIRRAEGAPELFPEELTVFHWHGDTFDLPEGAVRLASSAVCPNQAFLYNDQVLGLQFHIETTENSMNALIEHCGNELVAAEFIQTASEIRQNSAHIKTVNSMLESILQTL